MGGHSSSDLKHHRRIHIRKHGKRTTVSIHWALFRLLAMKLDCDPNSDEAWAAIKRWIQNEVDNGQFLETGLSPEISARIIYAIADPKIFRKELERKKAEPDHQVPPEKPT